jgi:cytochrome c nitrite reductase small subunit
LVRPWKWLAVGTSGLAFGLGLLNFRLSEAPSYLSDKPEVCINCHIMRPQFATWRASSHHTVATCNDCHVPQDNFVRKYLFKGSDGLRHSVIFTLHTEPQVIRIHEAGAKVVQENCIRCHGQIVDATPMGKLAFTTHDNPRPASASPLFPAPPMPRGASHADPKRKCIDCHRETPHGLVDSLSSAPNVRTWRLQPLGASLTSRKP